MPSSNIGTRGWRELAKALCAWYRQHARDLPFRRTRDPYAIWVSEVMLQQTRVEAVLLHYGEFLRRFPDLRSLAEAELGDVLAAWAGLGYYRRARQLHAAARRLHYDHAEWPREAASLRLLPGFGAYTAGAVASIAFGQAVPAVDGNVERVLARRLGLSQSPRRADGRRRILAAAQALLAGSDPAELNQALMELGALVCTPQTPRCDVCPWSGSCAGEVLGPERFPQRTARAASVDVACYTAVGRRDERFLLRRVPEGRHNAGLWELPTTAWHEGAPDADRALERLHELAASMGATWSIGPALVRIRHSITRHRIRCVAYAVTLANPPAASDRWFDAQAARALGLSAASQKILARLKSPLESQFQLFAGS
jgi:A/G-specific adenine glycosylase